MPEGYFSLVLYDSETLELVALTTTIDNVNNATQRFTAELQNKARFAELTAVRETLATASASVAAEDSAKLGDSEPEQTDNSQAAPTPVPSIASTRVAVVTQTNSEVSRSRPKRVPPTQRIRTKKTRRTTKKPRGMAAPERHQVPQMRKARLGQGSQM